MCGPGIAWKKTVFPTCWRNKAECNIELIGCFVPHYYVGHDGREAFGDEETGAFSMLERFPRRALDIRVCSDANATAGVVLGLGVDGISTVRNQEAGH